MTQEGFKRKLTAILSADVVGYSRLMEDNEEATIQTLNTYRNLMSTLIQQHRGRVVDMTGDNLMVGKFKVTGKQYLLPSHEAATPVCVYFSFDKTARVRYISK